MNTNETETSKNVDRPREEPLHETESSRSLTPASPATQNKVNPHRDTPAQTSRQELIGRITMLLSESPHPLPPNKDSEFSKVSPRTMTNQGTREIIFGNELKRIRTIGDANANEKYVISIQIDDDTLPLLILDPVIVGRSSDIIDANTKPDVDLQKYDAHARGVSRQHLRLSRDGDLIRVTDLGSLNGTYLNGMRLVPKQSRLLRNGDELMLGRLKVRVMF